MGVPIRLHWSFPLLLVLLAIPVGGHFLVAPFLESLVWIGALFACVVVHELSHCFVARRRGFAVRDVVLLPIGGASQISGLPGAPADELAIAVAGPAASLAVGLAMAFLGYLTGAHLWPPTLFVGAIASRLMWANFLLAGFNSYLPSRWTAAGCCGPCSPASAAT